MRLKPLFKSTLYLAVSVTLASSGFVFLTPPSSVHADPGCANGGAYMVFARGSGLDWNSGEATRFKDYVTAALGNMPVAWAELGNLDGDNDKQDSLDAGEYPAAGGIYGWVVYPNYPTSVGTGKVDLVNHLNARYANGHCANEALILGGYSQGADVVGYALQQDSGLEGYARAHVGAVALYGDPKFVGSSSYFDGCVQPAWAILSDCDINPVRGVLGGRSVYAPNDIWSRFSSYCSPDDKVCHGSGGLPAALERGHGPEYLRWIIAASANRVAAIAISKVNQLNPYSAPLPGGQTPPNGPPPPPPALPAVSRQMFLRGDSAVFAKDTLGDGGWYQETGPGSINKIAAGGRYQMVLDPCNAVFVKDWLGDGGWVRETECNAARAIAVSDTGLQVYIDNNDALWAKKGIGYGGWVREADDHTVYAVAVGGDNQVIISDCRAIYAKNTIGNGGWNYEVGCGNANAVAVSNTGVQMFIRGDAAIFAKNWIGDGGWVMEVGPGNADAIAVGGNTQMFLRGDAMVFAKNTIGENGWTQETASATVLSIAVSGTGRQMVRVSGSAIWAKDGIGYGGWITQVGPGNADAIAIG